MGRSRFVVRYVAMGALGKADVALDVLWRSLYGQPLPISGSAELALQVILECERKSWSPAPAPDVIDGQSGCRPRLKVCS